ncbi:methyl-CpG-binding domain-containing protein 5-like [Solanum stenotomum]|uniref:methyl-CpG-binding domain-containing protein 5-like n=1 Tax=Solanum stenotomum TaxID=172797 RepID=UPI0020D17E0E|nr:methyl-CpG-binding domain-containing protein 5-like [Solanum stenotomum]
MLSWMLETTKPNNSDVLNEGKVSDVTRTKLQIKRKITPMYRVNPNRPKWLPNNWTFETKVGSGGASAGQKDSYYFEPVTGSKFRLNTQVEDFLKTGLKREKLDLNRDAATPCEGKKQKKSGSKKEKKNVD